MPDQRADADDYLTVDMPDRVFARVVLGSIQMSDYPELLHLAVVQAVEVMQRDIEHAGYETIGLPPIRIEVEQAAKLT